MKLSEKQAIFSKNIQKLIAFATCNNIDLTLGEAYRTKSQGLLNYYGYDVERRKGPSGAWELYFIKRPRSSWTLSSNHLERLAIDFNFFINGVLTYKKEDTQILGDYWESLDPSNRWGGNYPKTKQDTPHFESI